MSLSWLPNAISIIRIDYEYDSIAEGNNNDLDYDASLVYEF